jgi:CubicO group peptidase (beta-lactamase class C family)
MRALELVDTWPAPHVSAAVLFDGVEIARRGEGDRQYRLASIAKVVTAMATLVGVEEGILHLEQQAGQPGCTIRHLLSHAGGYPFDGDQPVARPGTKRMYSNTGIEIAADTLAAAAAMSFEQYLGEAVLQPLGMLSTELRGSPAHGIWSTLDDTARFTAELVRPTLLTPLTAAAISTVQFPGLSGILPGVGRYADNAWGLGAELRQHKQPHWTGQHNSPTTFGHFGGAGTFLWVDPTARVAMVVLTDLPFDDWAVEALQLWPQISDAVLAEAGGG